MKKELINCIIIFILIIVTNIITQNYTKKCVSIMNQKLDILKETSLAAEKEDSKNLSDDVNTKIRDIENTWNECQEKLAYYIEHDELEKVTEALIRAKSNINAEEYNTAIENIDGCIFLLQHIEEKDKFSLKNIF